MACSGATPFACIGDKGWRRYSDAEELFLPDHGRVRRSLSSRPNLGVVAESRETRERLEAARLAGCEWLA